jgi:hypothetical protein
VDTGLATAAAFEAPAIAATPDGGLLIADVHGDRVLRVRSDGVTSIALRDSPTPGARTPTTSVSLRGLGGPGAITALPDGGFLLADTGDSRVLEVSREGHVSTVAGKGVEGYGGDGGPARRAKLSFPGGVAVLPDGGFLIADTDNSRVRRVWPDGHISTVAGNGRSSFSGDGGQATRASLDSPEDVAGLTDGGFLIADTFNDRVRRVWPDGHISTVAGGGSTSTPGHGVPATSAAIGIVGSIAVLPTGGFLIGTDSGVQRIWTDGTISTVVATSSDIFASGVLGGDGGPVGAAKLYGQLSSGASVAALPDGNTLVGYGSTVRLIVGPNGTRWLAAAMPPLQGLVSRNVYRARVVLTRPARVTLRVYGSMKGAPLAVASASRPAGESTVTVRLGRRVTPGLYAIDLRAQAGSQTTRAEADVYLGTSLTAGSIRAVVSGLVAGELNLDPNALITVGRCQPFGRLRVDCSIFGAVDYVQSMSPTPQGQLMSRTYFSPIRHGKRVFERNPHWQGPPVLADLGAAWNPDQFYGPYS